jgi:hypothetical protein
MMEIYMALTTEELMALIAAHPAFNEQLLIDGVPAAEDLATQIIWAETKKAGYMFLLERLKKRERGIHNDENS